MNLNSVRKLRAALAFLSSVALSAYAVAQSTSSTTDASDASKDQEVKLDKFLVTGSYIPMASEQLDISRRARLFSLTMRMYSSMTGRRGKPSVRLAR